MMKISEIFGIFIFFLIIDLLILMLRGLAPSFVWTLVISLLIVQVIFMFVLNERSIKKDNLDRTQHLWLLLWIGLFGLIVWIFLLSLESMGLTTILGG